MHSSRVGDISEYKAIVWLWSQGYEVFHNAGCTGDTDIIILKDHEDPPTKVQVKTLSPKSGAYSRRKRDPFSFRVEGSDEYRAKGIKILWVYEDQCGWSRDDFILPTWEELYA